LFDALLLVEINVVFTGSKCSFLEVLDSPFLRASREFHIESRAVSRQPSAISHQQWCGGTESSTQAKFSQTYQITRTWLICLVMAM
jgi:hypothetical protein